MRLGGALEPVLARRALDLALGRDPATIHFAHFTLIGDIGGHNLSKREGGLSVANLRDDGLEPEAIASLLARFGTSDSVEPVASLEALGLHDPDLVQLAEMVRVAYWPVALFAACRIGFDLMRAASGGNVRVTALGDLAFGIAAAWGLLWVWFWSALSPLIWVGSVTDFVDRIRVLIGRSGEDVGGVATILMVVVVWAFAAEVVRVIRAAARLVVGR